MDRRDTLKSILLGTVAGGLALHGCTPDAAIKEAVNKLPAGEHHFGRTPEEKAYIDKLNAEQFLNDHELKTVAVLSDLILPATPIAGSATDAEVPDFIEFMAKDIPELKPTLRGGLMWLDHRSNTDFDKEFIAVSEDQQKQILDTIAFPEVEIPIKEQPLEIQFFSLMRNLTLTGYYTSEIGIKDLGYVGNIANVWDGVPQEVLDQHGVAYEPEWLAKCIDQDKRDVVAQWDEEGNLLT